MLAFAFERDAAVVDTNIARVLARHGGRAAHRSRGAATSPMAACPTGDGVGVEPGLMDLGAVGVPTGAACDACPLAATCAWIAPAARDPIPPIGSAGVSTRQAPYAGSDRQARGELLRALTSGPVRATRSATTSSTRCSTTAS